MRKLFIISLLFIFYIFLIEDCFANFVYNSEDTITLEEYLNMKKSRKDFKTLKLNENGDVIFKNNVILTVNGQPLNENTAYTTIELKILFTAQGIKPRKGCNPKNIKKNGTLGCYIDNPDKK